MWKLSEIWTFDGIENKHDVYRGENCMKILVNLKRAHNEDN